MGSIYAAIPNCSLSVRPNRVLCWCGASTFQFKFTVEKIPQAFISTLCSEVLRAFISVLCFETTRILSSLFLPSPPSPSLLPQNPATTAALQNHHERIVFHLLLLSLQCGRTSFLFPFPVVKDCTYIVLLAVEKVLGSQMLCLVQYTTRLAVF